MKNSIISFIVLTAILNLFSLRLYGQPLLIEDAPLSDEESVVLLSVENNEENFSTFSVEPTSYDFLEVCVEPNIPPRLNLAVKNTSGGTENGMSSDTW